MCKPLLQSITAVIVRTLFVAAVLFVGTGRVQAFDAYTGCLTPGGTIIHVAPGDSPLKPCKPNETLIHLQEGINRSFDAHYDHDKICEAFHELALSAPALQDLGCPSTPTLTKEGTLTRVLRGDMRSNNYNMCGILSIEQKPEFGSGWFYVIKEGFSAEKFNTNLVTGREECFDHCNNDPKCIAASWSFKDTTGQARAADVGFCQIYHHSDYLKYDDGGWCGVTRDAALEGGRAFFDCTQRIDTGEQYWWVRVPGGQTTANCPGVTATP